MQLAWWPLPSSRGKLTATKAHWIRGACEVAICPFEASGPHGSVQRVTLNGLMWWPCCCAPHCPGTYRSSAQDSSPGSQQPQEKWPISRGPRTWPGAGNFGCVLAEALGLAMHWEEHAESVRHLGKVPSWTTDFKNLHQTKMSYKRTLLSPAFNPIEPAWSAIGHAPQLFCPVALYPQVGCCLPCLSPCPGLEFTMNPGGSLL
ncbi:hypothetical protein PAL_GLEAN10002142 [Pteropus alecto]|uniref:Uncharacterized protein n=1 Tax=Pteropus alecto TaxID=9402 RepID=L5K8Q9_PTEAL|nr:hypothetical protein PAL_GLEAN10002142 [Pteropus alecto]